MCRVLISIVDDESHMGCHYTAVRIICQRRFIILQMLRQARQSIPQLDQHPTLSRNPKADLGRQGRLGKVRTIWAMRYQGSMQYMHADTKYCKLIYLCSSSKVV